MKSFNERLKTEIKSNLKKYTKQEIKSFDDTDSIKYKLRAEYLKNGHINDPKRGHHLEYNLNTAKEANEMIDILSLVGIDAKISMRDNKYIVYIKNKNYIIKLLDILGAKDIKKEYRAISKVNNEKLNISRKVNFEVANIKKVANANLKQNEEIDILLQKYSIHSLDDGLKELIKARKKHPTASLSELAAIMGNVSKSTLNHRFKKIRELISE